MELQETLLLVEDDENDIELTLVALKSHNVANDVHVARDGVEALEYLADCEAKQAAGTGLMPRLILSGPEPAQARWNRSTEEYQDQSCN